MVPTVLDGQTALTSRRQHEVGHGGKKGWRIREQLQKKVVELQCLIITNL